MRVQVDETGRDDPTGGVDPAADGFVRRDVGARGGTALGRVGRGRAARGPAARVAGAGVAAGACVAAGVARAPRQDPDPPVGDRDVRRVPGRPRPVDHCRRRSAGPWHVTLGGRGTGPCSGLSSGLSPAAPAPAARWSPPAAPGSPPGSPPAAPALAAPAVPPSGGSGLSSGRSGAGRSGGSSPGGSGRRFLRPTGAGRPAVPPSFRSCGDTPGE